MTKTLMASHSSWVSWPPEFSKGITSLKSFTFSESSASVKLSVLKSCIAMSISFRCLRQFLGAVRTTWDVVQCCQCHTVCVYPICASGVLSDKQVASEDQLITDEQPREYRDRLTCTPLPTTTYDKCSLGSTERPASRAPWKRFSLTFDRLHPMALSCLTAKRFGPAIFFRKPFDVSKGAPMTVPRGAAMLKSIMADVVFILFEVWETECGEKRKVWDWGWRKSCGEYVCRREKKEKTASYCFAFILFWELWCTNGYAM